VTYRLSDHTTADDASRYRDDAEVGRHWSAEPIARLRAYLTREAQWGRAREEELLRECARKVEEAAKAWIESTVESSEAMFDFTYAHAPRDLLEQREAFLDRGRDRA
jgi:pyruvate dehydrogenase E1 component alpha subunit